MRWVFRVSLWGLEPLHLVSQPSTTFHQDPQPLCTLKMFSVCLPTVASGHPAKYIPYQRQWNVLPFCYLDLLHFLSVYILILIVVLRVSPSFPPWYLAWVLPFPLLILPCFLPSIWLLPPLPLLHLPHSCLLKEGLAAIQGRPLPSPWRLIFPEEEASFFVCLSKRETERKWVRWWQIENEVKDEDRQKIRIKMETEKKRE